jgi:hypothetical protein
MSLKLAKNVDVLGERVDQLLATIKGIADGVRVRAAAIVGLGVFVWVRGEVHSRQGVRAIST